MKAFLTRLFLTLLVLVLLIGLSALGVFYYLKYTEAMNLQSELNTTKIQLTDANSKVAELEASGAVGNKDLTFSDSGLEFDIKYPAGWTMEANTKLEDKNASPVVITGYSLTLEKGTSTLMFSKILGGVGDMAVVYKSSEYDVVELKDASNDSLEILRVSKKDEDKWRYVSKVDCDDVPEEETVETGDFCGAGGFFSGFGERVGASTVALTSSDEEVIKEADKIVISTL
jgi:hypothetical protein